MSMSKLARSGMMDRLRKRMGEEQRQAIADKFGDEFRRGMEGSDRNPSADVSSALEPLRRAGQSAIDAGELRQGDAARAMGDHAEPDADDMGGPSDEDADDLAPRLLAVRWIDSAPAGAALNRGCLGHIGSGNARQAQGSVDV